MTDTALLLLTCPQCVQVCARQGTVIRDIRLCLQPPLVLRCVPDSVLPPPQTSLPPLSPTCRARCVPDTRYHHHIHRFLTCFHCAQVCVRHSSNAYIRVSHLFSLCPDKRQAQFHHIHQFLTCFHCAQMCVDHIVITHIKVLTCLHWVQVCISHSAVTYIRVSHLFSLCPGKLQAPFHHIPQSFPPVSTVLRCVSITL